MRRSRRSEAGKLTALAVASRRRVPALPTVPTLAEAGYPDATVEPWFGVYGPAGLPPEIVARLNAASVAALALPEVKQKLATAGFAAEGSTPDALDALSRREYERFGAIAREAGLSIE